MPVKELLIREDLDKSKSHKSKNQICFRHVVVINTVCGEVTTPKLLKQVHDDLA